MEHILTADQFKELVLQANLAPSVHNVQPARWRRAPGGRIEVIADLTRALPAADPHNQDVALSCGCAIEGMLIALSAIGLAGCVENMANLSAERGDLAPVVATIKIVQGGRDSLYPFMAQRYTWRSAFQPSQPTELDALQSWDHRVSDATVTTDPSAIAMLSVLNDKASLRFMSEPRYRAELVSWMRLQKRHSRYALDGMNLEALHMSVFEGIGAGLVLSPSVFPFLRRLGLASGIVSEDKKTTSVSAIALFHRPREENRIVSGRAFYRFWLKITELGFTGWPMAALADDEATNQTCCKHFGIPEDHQFINAMRLGKVFEQPQVRARIPAEHLIWESE
ncbi:hypothetical protein [Pseudovibrio sp. Alg231-02]|uniref:hypothetical protein n=1 Tax=Pseudovibrio sp. Alg231-02 TaxID=1922223 RepID=UPI000D55C0D2|nr:hypothetical protein [Pseudovibrio sp. Alg231-02]